MLRLVLRFTLGFLLILPARAHVVINEIFYHGPEDLSDVQWVELFNPDEVATSLGGWTFGRGIRFTFPEGAAIAPHGFAVLCKNRERFQEFYDVAVMGEFEKALKKGGERIELRNAAGDLVDAVRFNDHAPWPTGPDGLSASLERICATAPGGLPANWAGSPLSPDPRKPGGTPGKPNTITEPVLPPEISKVTFLPDRAQPGQPITVEADVATDLALRGVTLRYRVVGVGTTGEEISVPMTNLVNHRFRATVPGQEPGRIVRFRIRAEDQTGVARIYPGETEPRPALSCLVLTNITPGKIPFGFVIHTDPELVTTAQRRPSGPGGFNEDDGMRFMMRMQLGMMLDLPALWSGLTLSNVPPNADLEPLRSAFIAKSRERDQLEEKLLAGKDLPAAMQKLPESVKSFQSDLEKAVKPMLAASQLPTLEAWRSRPTAGPGFFGRNPEFMLRQILPFEQAYLFLATRTNATPAQFASVREVVRDGIQQRDALTDELRGVMEEDGDRDKLQARLGAIEGRFESRLKEILSPKQARQLADWREQNRPPMMRGPGGPGGRRGGPGPVQSVQNTSAFVFVDPLTRQARLYDFVQAVERSGGWKVHFQKDRPLNGLSSINLIFERSERWVLAEPLAYEFYRDIGAAAPLTDFVRLWIDGEPVGYHLLIEQPNKAFLRRNNLRDDGDLFKLLWYERDVVSQHEKKTNPQTGHADLLGLIDRLEQTKTNPVIQWEVIRKEFDAEQVITHYAARTLLSDWDGFFNNYFTYHDLRGTRKWTLYPWDQDQTWGDPGGGQNSGLVIAMPLTYGAEGDVPPGSRGGRPPSGFAGPRMGGPGWWRQGGAFSKPLLANPIFREHFLACVKELLDSHFNQDMIFPWIDRMHDQLIDEVRFRAELSKDDPARGVDRFEEELGSLKRFVVERRKWLLAQDEIQKAGAFDRTALH